MVMSSLGSSDLPASSPILKAVPCGARRRCGYRAMGSPQPKPTPCQLAYSDAAWQNLEDSPDPFDDLRNHVAEQQQRRRPDERRKKVRHLKAAVRHFEDAGGERHRSPQRTEEAPDI